MYKAFPYEKTSVRTKLYKCFYVFISYRERISFISDAAPRRLTSKCACGRVLFKSQLLTLGYFCFGYRPVGSYIFFGNRSHFYQKNRLSRRFFCIIQNFLRAVLYFTHTENRFYLCGLNCALYFMHPEGAGRAGTQKASPCRCGAASRGGGRRRTASFIAPRLSIPSAGGRTHLCPAI